MDGEKDSRVAGGANEGKGGEMTGPRVSASPPPDLPTPSKRAYVHAQAEQERGRQ